MSHVLMAQTECVMSCLISVPSSTDKKPLQAPRLNPELGLLFVSNFNIFSLCGVHLGSMVPSHLPKHASEWTGYTKLPLSVKMCTMP